MAMTIIQEIPQLHDIWGMGVDVHFGMIAVPSAKSSWPSLTFDPYLQASLESFR